MTDESNERSVITEGPWPFSNADPLQAPRERNLELFSELQRMNKGVDVSAVRLAVLIDLLLPTEGAFRQMFETAFEMNLNQVLEQAVAEARRAKLTEGISVKQGPPPEGAAG